MALLGQAFGPVALVLVGITLAQHAGRPALARRASVQALVKNLVHPLLVAALGWLLGLRGLPLAVMVVAASLPIGANVFLFSQRYRVAEELVTASVVVSTVLALVTLSLRDGCSGRAAAAVHAATASGRQPLAQPAAVRRSV